MTIREIILLVLLLGAVSVALFNSRGDHQKCLYVAKQWVRGATVFKLGLVTDLDLYSRDVSELRWIAYLKFAVLQYNSSGGYYGIEFPNETKTLSSSVAQHNRAMELSELIYFGSNLLAFCDYTGMVFELDLSGAIYPRYVISDGDGKKPKAFKTEWATVKDGVLYIGSMGKEWTDSKGTILHRDPQWIKILDSCGRIRNENWEEKYNFLRQKSGTEFPGYILHEAVIFHPQRRVWIFLPRRMSSDVYTPEKDMFQGSNKVFVVNEEFTELKIVEIGSHDKLWGFTSAKLIPNTDDIVALRVLEVHNRTMTQITVFSMWGEVKTATGDWVTVSDEHKYEGIEILEASL